MDKSDLVVCNLNVRMGYNRNAVQHTHVRNGRQDAKSITSNIDDLIVN